MNELWQEVCFILHDISQSGSEELYEQKIIQSLEKLGWSRFRKEILLKESRQLGSAGTIIPDIIVKSLERSESFVIEVKKPSIDIENASHKNQLFSYMRQLKLHHGLLIGNKIQIFYDGEFNKTDDPTLLKSIDIQESDKNGALFIELFQKNSFSYSQLDQFAEKTLKEIASEIHKKKLRNKLLSEDYRKQIKQFVIEDLSQSWDEETIKSVLAELTFSITSQTNDQSTPIALPNVQPPSQDSKIGKLVRSSMELIIHYCNISEQEILNLKSSTYSKQKFNINYPFFQEVTSNAPKPHRYWKDKYLINNKYYVVTSEWYKESLPLFRDYITKIQKDISG